jgi:hypothetical protein
LSWFAHANIRPSTLFYGQDHVGHDHDEQTDLNEVAVNQHDVHADHLRRFRQRVRTALRWLLCRMSRPAYADIHSSAMHKVEHNQQAHHIKQADDHK